MIKIRLQAGITTFERYTVTIVADEGAKIVDTTGGVSKGVTLDGGEYDFSFPLRPGSGIAIVQDSKLRLTDASGKTEVSASSFRASTDELRSATITTSA